VSFDNIYLVTDKLELTTQEELNDLEKRLGMPVPVGYAEFISKLGTGTYCDLLRVYEPARILRECKEAHNRWAEYFFWEVGQGVLAKDEVLKCLIFADTIDGDEVVAHPAIGDRLFVLPRHDDMIYWVPKSFEAPLEWHGQKGLVRPEPGFRYFESGRDRKFREFFTAKETFSISDLAPYFSDFWMQFGKQVIRKKAEDYEEEAGEKVAILFVKEIGGRIQLAQSLPDDKRMSVRIDYDADSADEVAIFGTFLTEMGFYETGTMDTGV
jgi:hypothetical protein